MSTSTRAVTCVSVRSARPTYAYGIVTPFPLVSGAAVALGRAALALPEGAVVDSATLSLLQIKSQSGSRTVTVRPNGEPFGQGMTWSRLPTLASTSVAVTKASPADRTLWEFDVTAHVQAFASGTLRNYGWRITTNSPIQFRGSTGAVGQPTLTVEWHVPAQAPTDLSPVGGAVSVGKPVFTWNGGDDQQQFQVQISSTASAGALDHDTGWIVSTSGSWDSAPSAWAGLADDAATYWRVRVVNPAGIGPFSPWVTFSRANLPVITMTNPQATVEDVTPPWEWTVAGGTQASWQATVRTSSGVLLDSGSGRTETAWTPKKGVSGEGQIALGRLRVTDDVVRVATPGAPTYAQATFTYAFGFDPTVDPVDSLTIHQDGWSPVVTIQGTRSVGAPDEVAIYRNNVLVDRVSGADAFDGIYFKWTDRTARMGHQHAYKIRPIVNGKVSATSPPVMFTPSCKGLWLMEPEHDGALVPIWGDEPGDWQQPEVAALHVPITGDGPAVRRRLARPPLSAELEGTLVDVGSYLADDTRATLEGWAEDDPSTTYRLVAGDYNLLVRLEDVKVWPTPLSSEDDRVLLVSLFCRGV